jgi:hypothetical protein
MESTGNVILKRRAVMQETRLLFFLLFFAVACNSKPTEMENRLSVKGVLQDSSGQPIRDAAVMITDGTHEFTDMASMTNDSGEFYLPNIVVPGKYTLQIEANNQSQKKEIDVTGKETIRIRF